MEKGRLPETSNFDSPPGKAGGFPRKIIGDLDRAMLAQTRARLANEAAIWRHLGLIDHLNLLRLHAV